MSLLTPLSGGTPLLGGTTQPSTTETTSETETETAVQPTEESGSSNSTDQATQNPSDQGASADGPTNTNSDTADRTTEQTPEPGDRVTAGVVFAALKETEPANQGEAYARALALAMQQKLSLQSLVQSLQETSSMSAAQMQTDDPSFPGADQAGTTRYGADAVTVSGVDRSL